MEVWRSPRAIEADIRDYLRKRFEDYMCMEDRGDLSRGLAISALREEMNYALLDSPVDQTQPIDTATLRKILEGDSGSEITT